MTYTLDILGYVNPAHEAATDDADVATAPTGAPAGVAFADAPASAPAAPVSAPASAPALPLITATEPEATFARWYRDSPIGDIYLTADENALTGVWFDTHQKYWEPKPEDILNEKIPVLQQTAEWLDIYFEGRDPGALPPINLYRVTPFRRMVCEEMCKIPFGAVTSYGAIAHALEARTGKPKMSARAVGGGVGHNPVSIVIPCHRVVGANKSLTGYGGGIQRKITLLELEGWNMAHFTVPTKGTAL